MRELTRKQQERLAELEKEGDRLVAVIDMCNATGQDPLSSIEELEEVIEEEERINRFRVR